MISLDDFRVAMRPLTRHWKQEAPTTAEEWQDYYMILGHLDVPVLAAAVLKVMATHVYPTFPKPAVILEAANYIAAPARPAGLEAWGEVARMARRHGHLHPPGEGWDFDDPTTVQVVAALGWYSICQDENEMVMRAHFIKAYEQVQRRQLDEAAQLPAVQQTRRAIEAQRHIAHVAARLNGRREQP